MKSIKNLRKSKKLKMYVWEDVLTDYTSGLIVAYAYNLEHARKIVLKQHSILSASDVCGQPMVFSRPGAAYVYGGS